jgi:hypothetical protein
MNDKNDPQKFLNFARKKLQGDANGLDADTREKLLQMRHRAIESSLDNKIKFSDWASLPIIGFITALIFISLIYVKPILETQADTSMEDLEILISNDPIEFYANLDFLQKHKEPESEKRDF